VQKLATGKGGKPRRNDVQVIGKSTGQLQAQGEKGARAIQKQRMFEGPQGKKGPHQQLWIGA